MLALQFQDVHARRDWCITRSCWIWKFVPCFWNQRVATRKRTERGGKAKEHRDWGRREGVKVWWSWERGGHVSHEGTTQAIWRWGHKPQYHAIIIYVPVVSGLTIHSRPIFSIDIPGLDAVNSSSTWRSSCSCLHITQVTTHNLSLPPVTTSASELPSHLVRSTQFTW